MRIAVDDQPIDYAAGDSVAVAIVRAGQHPQHGGTLCLAGDCGNCSAEIDGIAFTRTCLTPAQPGLRVTRHPAVGGPPLRLDPPVDPVASPAHAATHLRRQHADLVVIGAGDSGRAAADEARAAGREVTVLAGELGDDVVGVYPGPLVVARLVTGEMLHVHAHDVVIATGAAELHPVCDGNMLLGIYTAAAAEQLRIAGVDLGAVANVDLEQ
ncbi:MAG TPA: 2Fe-2S iron-sulfur cluster-binding protein, partial [Ilumatobacteraceae bacterium]